MQWKFTNVSVQLALAFSAASGLIYEVAATNLLFYYYIQTSYSVATVLGVFMFGLGVGSLAVHMTSNRVKNKTRLFIVLQLLTAFYAFFVLAHLEFILNIFLGTRIFLISLAILFLPTAFLGASFPLAGAIFKGEKIDFIGLVYASDLAGAIVGSLMAGFWLIPVWGNQKTVMFGAVVNLLASFVLSVRFWKILPIISALSFLIANHFSWSIFPDNAPQTDLLFEEASPYGLVQVRQNNAIYQSSVLLLKNRIQCGYDSPVEGLSEKNLARLALMPLAKTDLKVLEIGLGCGLTLGETLKRPDVVVDQVELNPTVVKANRMFSKVLEDKRVNLIVGDGLKYLRDSPPKYDSILINIETMHDSPLFTVEAFRLVEKALEPNGTFSVWTGIEDDGDPFGIAYTDVIYYSLKEVFQYVYSFSGVLLASNSKLNYEEHRPTTPYTINTVDKNTLNIFADKYFNHYTVPVSLLSRAYFFQNRGLAFEREEDTSRALNDLNKAVALSPDPEFLAARGRLKSAAGDEEGARRDFIAALDGYGRRLGGGRADAGVLYKRGMILAALRDPERAAADFTAALAIDPGNAAAYQERGICFTDLGDDGRAVDDFTRAMKLDPGNPTIPFNLGVFFINRGKTAAALPLFERTLELDPANAGAFMGKARALLALGEHRRAEEAFQRATALGYPPDPALREALRGNPAP